MSSAITKIDDALSRYYARFDRKDYSNDGKGKFRAFCEDSGFDTDMVLEELELDAQDCNLVEFDDNFPLKGDEKQDRNETIYNIIKKCYEIPNAYIGSAEYDPIEVKKEHFMLLTHEETQKIMSLKYKSKKEKDEMLVEITYNKLKKLTQPLIDSCYAVMCKAEQDQVFLQLLHMGEEKLNGKPYIHLVSDLYARDRINYYLHCKSLIEKEFNENKHNIEMEKIIIPILKPDSWSVLNKHTKIISQFSNDQKELKILEHSINSYFHRLTPLMDVSTSNKINEDYESICEYISNAIGFVETLARDEKYQQDQYSAVCPFQYDFVIAFNNVISEEKKVTTNILNDDDDDDDDDIKDPNEGCDNKDDLPYYDCFGNIKNRLKDSNCEYSSRIINVNDKLRFRPQFDNFQRQVQKKLVNEEKKRQQELKETKFKLNKNRKRYEELKKRVQKLNDKAVELRENQKDLSKNDTAKLEKLEEEFNVFDKMEKRIKELKQEECTDKDINEYPRRFRFISILDRREPSNENKESKVIENDELIFFEPPRNCFNFAKDKKCDNVKYFSNSKECILPKDKKFDELIKKKEDKECKEDKKLIAKQILQTKVINTLHSMKNGMLVLSFHVESVDEIRCYIYLNGNMVRFLPDDLKNYLPEFFIDDQRNKAYWNSNEEEGLNTLIKNIKAKLIDRRFESFYIQYKLNDDAMKSHITKKMKTEIDRLKKEKQADEEQQKKIDNNKKKQIIK